MSFYFSEVVSAHQMLRRTSSVLTLIVFCTALFSSLHAQEEKLSGDLVRAVESSQNAIPVVVVMQQLHLVSLQLMEKSRPADVERFIKQRTLESQMDIRQTVNDLLSRRTMSGEKPISQVKFFWTTNAFMAKAMPEVIMDFASRDDVQAIYLDRKLKLAPTIRQAADVTGEEFTYGLQKLQIPELRQKYPEINGQGVIVGILDTGIDANHPELQGRTIVFKDFVGDKTEAYDDHGHGTHVAGTIGGTGAGGIQIGVAPAVKYVIGKIFTAEGSASLSGILRGMEWVVDPDGNPNTPDAPRVINNSWGGSATEDISKDPFSQPVLTWVQMNIVPSFAAGNSGPRARTVGSPGTLPQSFTVGATDENDKIASFSSRGPVRLVIDGKKVEIVKPDVSAPGVDILSSLPGGKYEKWSGTSMATPHVTGAIALLLQAKPSLTVAQVREILVKSADDLGTAGADNSFGAGRINMLKAYELAAGY